MYIADLEESLVKFYTSVPIEELQKEVEDVSRELGSEFYSFELDLENESIQVFSDGQAVDLEDAA
jgi:hypothetical protein